MKKPALGDKDVFNPSEAAEFYGLSRRKFFRFLNEATGLPFIAMYNNESGLAAKDRVNFDAAYRSLEGVMIDPNRPNKNKGEVCSLAYAKATGIPVFATDEMNLQPIIDSKLNTGMNDITCLRIVDIIEKAHIGEIDVPRKLCKALWIIAGKKKELFDSSIWPL